MRVISGSLRGLKLSAPDGINTRPTLDRVKEAVFSMLMPYLNGAVVLDAFAGSGAMGIEALSRGAFKSVFVDYDLKAIKCIKSNLDICKLDDVSEVVNGDVVSFLNKTDMKFSLIFLDPPYSSDIYTSVLKVISDRNLLLPEGLIVVEWDYEFGFDTSDIEFNVIKQKKYGRVGITVLNRG